METLLQPNAIDLPWASDLLTFWKSIPFPYVLAGHCLFVTGMAPEFKGNWLVHYVVRRQTARAAPERSAGMAGVAPTTMGPGTAFALTCETPAARHLEMGR